MLQSGKTAEAGQAETPVILDEFPINHRAVCLQNKVSIRPYQEADRPRIRQLCWETGFFGKPADGLFQDRELFADLFTNAYLDYAPEWALVAEVDGRVVGYLLGAVSKHFDWMLMRSGFKTTCKMVFRLAAGRYAQHPPSKHFVRWLLTVAFREQPRHPENAAHLHFDLDQGFRGRGICVRLWNIYQQRLRTAGLKECYGAFFSYGHHRPELVYARYGFAVFDRRRTTLFQPHFDGPVEIVCVRKAL